MQPVDRLNLSATMALPFSVNYCSGLVDPNWHAMEVEEYRAHIDNGTYRLV